jgi:hypothetical protein
MSKLNDTVTDFLFPPNMRPYLTFRTATAVALLAAVASALIRAFVSFPPEPIAKWESGNLLHSPLSLSLYYLFLAVVLWLVYATRNRLSLYVWRVWVYCMVLAGALIALVTWIFPLRAS